VGQFLTPLELEYIDGEKWKITAPFDYHLGAPDGLETVKIPPGFVTDFASVPRILWNILPPTGLYGKAAVVHDWLYQHRTLVKLQTAKAIPIIVQIVDRGEADSILLEGMEVLGVSWFTRHTIYAGVRVGGWKPWNEYRRKASKK
jgi:hypothetical protein